MKYTSCNVTKRKNRFQARVKYYDKTKGKWAEHTKLLPKEVAGKKEAKRLAAKWMDELNLIASNAPTIKEDKSVGTVVENYLLSQLASGEIEKSSYRQEHVYLRRWIIPYIGGESFYTLQRESITGWLAKLNQDGLSQNTICCAYYLLRKVYKYYCDIEELNKNPFDGVKRPKKGKPKVTYLTEEQIQRFLRAVDEDFTAADRERTAFLLAFYSGLRRAEISGLRWRDVNLKEGLISVETSIGNGYGGQYTKQPKTKSSIRTFPIVPQLIEILKERYELVQPQPNWFVCGKGTKYYQPTTFNKDFRKWADRHELVDAYDNPITIHGLRHNFATMGVNSKMDISSLSRMLGHSSRAMTLDIYADASKDALIVAADKLGKFIK